MIYHGGIRPPSIRPCCCPCKSAHATVIGFWISLTYFLFKNMISWQIFDIPETAPTAPKLCSSIIDASHSIFPSKVKFEPIPALVNGQSCVWLNDAFSIDNKRNYLLPVQQQQYKQLLLHLCHYSMLWQLLDRLVWSFHDIDWNEIEIEDQHLRNSCWICWPSIFTISPTNMNSDETCVMFLWFADSIHHKNFSTIFKKIKVLFISKLLSVFKQKTAPIRTNIDHQQKQDLSQTRIKLQPISVYCKQMFVQNAKISDTKNIYSTKFQLMILLFRNDSSDWTWKSDMDNNNPNNWVRFETK